MADREATLAKVLEEVIIGVVRYDDAADAALTARTFVEAGLNVVEITMTTPGAIELITELAWQNDEIVVAAGSVRTADEVEAVNQAGAKIVVSPHTSERVIEATLERGLVSVAGASSPTEIVRAHELGASIVKVYPARLLGGPTYFRTIRQPIRDIPVLAGGPVNIDEIIDYLDAGAVALNMGTAFAPMELIATNNWTAVTDRIDEACAVVSAWKSNRPEEA